MIQAKVSYPALFYRDVDQDGYVVTFPDFIHSATQGDDIPEAIEMASEYLGLTLASYLEEGLDIPVASNINSLSLSEDDPFKDDPELASTFDVSQSFVSMVTTDVSDYLDMDTPVKKTLTIPKWADTFGKEMNINFSQTLTDSIAEMKMKGV